MKTHFSSTFIAAILCGVIAPGVMAGGPGVDLSTRRAIYVAANPTSIDLKNDKYVAAGGTINVKKSSAASCEGNKCKYNLGIIAIKSGGPGRLDTYGQYSGAFGMVGNSIMFLETESTKEQVLPVNLAIGKNVVTFTIDPQKKIAETDETNNSMTVTIIVD